MTPTELDTILARLDRLENDMRYGHKQIRDRLAKDAPREEPLCPHCGKRHGCAPPAGEPEISRTALSEQCRIFGPDPCAEPRGHCAVAAGELPHDLSWRLREQGYTAENWREAIVEIADLRGKLAAAERERDEAKGHLADAYAAAPKEMTLPGETPRVADIVSELKQQRSMARCSRDVENTRAEQAETRLAAMRAALEAFPLSGNSVPTVTASIPGANHLRLYLKEVQKWHAEIARAALAPDADGGGAPPTPDVYDEIRAERKYQDDRWGGATHDDEHSSRAFFNFIGQYARGERGKTRGIGTRQRFIVIAALAVAAVESHDRPHSEIDAEREDYRDDRGGGGGA